MKKYKVAICVVTYYPQKEKLMDTLRSIVNQRNVDFQIIVSDDGSKENYFEEVKRYFADIGFVDYKLVALAENQGTVRNMEQAILAANSEYIKDISPGDCLTRDTILAEWIEHLENSGKLWSFCDAYYYSKNESQSYIFHPCYANPQLVEPYLRRKDLLCRWNYVVLDDIALGAAVLCERDLMLRYIKEITGKVKYAEDNIYRLLMFDGYVADYFQKEAVLYEYGSGISTSQNEVWAKRLNDDWEATNSIILSRPAMEPLQKRMKRVLEDRQRDRKCVYLFKRLIEKGRIAITLKRHFNKRLANCGGCIDCT